MESCSSSNIGADARSRIAAFDSWGNLTPWNPGANGTVMAAGVQKWTVYFGGAFSMAAGQPRAALAAVDASGALTAWNPGASGPTPVPIRALTAEGWWIRIGGQFTRIDGRLLSNFARIPPKS